MDKRPPPFSTWKPYPLPHLSVSLLLAPTQPSTSSGLTWRPEGGGQSPCHTPLPPWTLEVLRPGCLWGGGGPAGGLDPSREATSHPTSCFWNPAPLWVCECVLIFFMEKMDKKKIERERYLTAINWPHVAPPCLSVSVHLRCGEGAWGLCRAPGDRALLFCSWQCTSPSHPAPPGTQCVGCTDGGIKE